MWSKALGLVMAWCRTANRMSSTSWNKGCHECPLHRVHKKRYPVCTMFFLFLWHASHSDTFFRGTYIVRAVPVDSLHLSL